jgi:hypothetical protein
MNHKKAVLEGLETGKQLPHNDRLTQVFNNLLNIEDGYCVEIGAGYGETTVKLLNSVKNYKIIVVDPFEDGWGSMPESYGKPYPFFLFQNAIKQFSDKVILIKKSSDDSSVIDELLKYKPIIFSFVDGLQYTDNVLYDLNMMDKLNCKVICVDDYNRLTNISQVPLAIEEFIKNNKNYDVVYQNDNKEIYLVRNEKN